MKTPTWDEYFLEIAKTVSIRSKDSTKHGCVIVDDRNRIVGTGYNDFPSGVQHENWPYTRPFKYSAIIHAELNCCLNSTIKPSVATAYITGEPCNRCLFSLHQFGVTRVVYLNRHGSFEITEEDRNTRNRFLEETKLKLEVVNEKAT